MINTTHLRQRQVISTLPLEKKAFEDQLKLFASNKLAKKEIKAKIDSHVFGNQDEVQLPILERDEYVPTEEDLAPNDHLMGKDECKQM